MTNVSAIDRPMHHTIELLNNNISLVIAQLSIMLKKPQAPARLRSLGLFRDYRLVAVGACGSEEQSDALEQSSCFSQ